MHKISCWQQATGGSSFSLDIRQQPPALRAPRGFLTHRLLPVQAARPRQAWGSPTPPSSHPPLPSVPLKGVRPCRWLYHLYQGLVRPWHRISAVRPHCFRLCLYSHLLDTSISTSVLVLPQNPHYPAGLGPLSDDAHGSHEPFGIQRKNNHTSRLPTLSNDLRARPASGGLSAVSELIYQRQLLKTS